MLHKNKSRIVLDNPDGYVFGWNLSNVIFRILQSGNKVGMRYSYTLVVDCAPIETSKARENVKMSLNAHSEFLEQNYMKRFSDLLLVDKRLSKYEQQLANHT